MVWLNGVRYAIILGIGRIRSGRHRFEVLDRFHLSLSVGADSMMIELTRQSLTGRELRPTTGEESSTDETTPCLPVTSGRVRAGRSLGITDGLCSTADDSTQRGTGRRRGRKSHAVGQCIVAMMLGTIALTLPFRAVSAEVNQDAASKTTASAATTDAKFTQLALGFSSAGRVGTWLPIRCEATGLPSRSRVVLAVECRDTRGDVCTSTVAAAEVDASGRAALSGSFMVGRQSGELTVLLLSDASDELLRQTVVTIDPVELRPRDATASVSTSTTPRVCDQLVLARHAQIGLLAAGEPAGLTDLLTEPADSSPALDQLLDLTVESVAEFPDRRRNWDAVDVCVLQDDFSLTAPQVKALQEWVATGGHLIVSAGGNQNTLLAQPVGEWIRELFGIGTAESDPPKTQDLSPLQNHVSGATAIQTNRMSVSYLRITSEQPRTLVTSLQGPMLSRRSVGAGIITLVPVELNARPMSSWLSLSQFYEQLIFERRRETSAEQSRGSGRISSAGLTDLSTQLAAAVDAIPPDQRWSSWQAMLLILIYLGIIGPLDYFIVTHVLRRPALTWITFPVFVAVACGLTLLSGASHSTPEVVRQVHLLDVTASPSSANAQFVRARSWNSLSTSQSRQATVRASAAAWLPVTASDAVFNWHGRAENVFGGLYRPGGSGLGQQSSRRTDVGPSRFESVSLIAQGSVAFLNEAEATTTGLFESHLYLPAGGLLEGSFQHHLPAAISSWMIVFGNRAYVPSLGSDLVAIEPGTDWSRTKGGVRVTDLRDVLRRVKAIEFQDARGKSLQPATTMVQSEYNVEDRDPLNILRMISLFDLAGGESYVKLHNDYLRSDQIGRGLQYNTALLIGTTTLPVSSLTLDETDLEATASDTIVRLFLPVERRPASTAESEQ